MYGKVAWDLRYLRKLTRFDFGFVFLLRIAHTLEASLSISFAGFLWEFVKSNSFNG